MVADVREVLERGNITWPRRNERPDFLRALFYMARQVFVPVAFQVAIEETDQRAPSPSEARTLFFGLPSRFLFNARALARLRQSGKLLDHLRLTYEAIATPYNNTGGHNDTNIVNETRLKELAGQFDDLADFFDRYEKATGPVARSNNASAFLQYTPSVPKTRWDALMKRYLNLSLVEDEGTLRGGVAVQSPSIFSAVFEVHARQGDQVTDDIVGSLCVQALVDYMSSDLLTSLLGGSRMLAIDTAFKRCFSDAYRFYDVAINAYFHQPLSREVADITRVVALVNQTFFGGLRGGNAPGDLPNNSSTPSHRRSNLDLAVAGLSELNPKVFIESYDHFPQGTASSIKNWMQLAAFAAAGGKSPTGTPLWELLSEDVGRAAGKFRNFRVSLAHMEDPFYVTNVSAAVLMAGVGARIAGALYYDHVAARGMNDMAKIYAENQKCLSPESGSESPDLEIQGAVASVDVAWAALKATGALKFSSAASVSPPNSSVADNELFFSFFCYLFCGDPDGERLCNVPLQHSTSFSAVFGCGSGSFMNPQKKCRMGE